MKIKDFFIEFIYIFLCLILGSVWGIYGLYSIINQMINSNSDIESLPGSFVSILISFYLFKFWFNRLKKNKESKKNPTKPILLNKHLYNKGKRIGGWLIWVCIGLFLNFSNSINNINLYENDVLNTENITLLMSIEGGSSILSSLKFSYFSTSIIMTAFIFLIILFFQRKRVFVKVFIVIWISIILLHTIDYILTIAMSEGAIREWKMPSAEKNIILSFGSALIWIPYFVKSKRVKETFIK
jgi:hypothetical protein